MAKFCKYCGSPLEEGQICTCPQAQAEAGLTPPPPQPGPQPGPQQPQPGPQNYQQGYQQGYNQGYQPQTPPPAAPAAPNPVVVALKKILPYLKQYVKTPLAAAQELMAQKDMVFALVLMVIQAIAGGLLLFAVVNSICGAISDVIGFAGSLVGNRVSVAASLPMCLIFGILATAVAIVIFVALLFAVCKILGVNCDFVDVLVAAAAHSPLVTVLMLVSLIFCLFLLQVGLVIFLLAMLTWIVLAVPTLQALAPAAAGQSKFWICAIVAIALTLGVGTWASAQLAFMSVGHSVIRDNSGSHTINEYIEQIGSDEIADMLDDFISDLF